MMRISDLRDETSEQLRSFAWSQWAQLGILATSGRRDRWAVDPEALLLFSFEVGRDDPRLYDEVLGWLVVNERLISVQRIRNLCRDDDDRALADASLAWVSRWRPRARLVAKGTGLETQPVPLFRRERTPTRDPDPDFMRRGFLKPLAEPAGGARPPDPLAPIAFSFRLRHLFGIGTRAEVMRLLLCVDAQSVTAGVVAESAGFAKRNTREALDSLATAGVVDAVTVANEHRFRVKREEWARFLEVEDLPGHRDWPQLLGALRRLLRWLWRPELEALSDYMLASEARLLAQELVPELRYAGVRVTDRGALGAAFWDDFVVLCREAVGALENPV